MTGSRPTTIGELQARLRYFVTDASLEMAARFRPRPSDVIITPYSKCGTTWMQQIVHGLRTGGSMAFGEITEVMPWLELAHDLGQTLDAPQVARPRAFKSHQRWDEIPKGGRYIVVMRDPVDAMLSLYRFMDGWMIERGAISVEDFAAYFLQRDASDSYWEHARSWWRRRSDDNVLLLSFEGLKRDLPGVVTRVADFIGVDDPEARRIAIEQANFAFMKTHAGHFDDHFLRRVTDRAMGLPPDGEATKVSSGKTGQGRVALPNAVRGAFADKWDAVMGAEFGLADYAALQAELARDI
ncbi:sulfotransferase domain-containing protein [Roseovarius pelagicus]|uniref:Sulfotransferase domain-containing protein n=1 Tax=Roseovarius pelagicus TaxID=2980108 RepID=A0ABY6DLE1_9RHOB|nr:sulfotransferase domain-containing protein [Roseovarius pelagicus]UXX84590.1 sulfotransferase domain-containing protein [Roseovarius pelagicus]